MLAFRHVLPAIRTAQNGLIGIPHLGVLRVTDTVDTDAFGATATDKQCVPRARVAIT
jgi:hypothetical protein